MKKAISIKVTLTQIMVLNLLINCSIATFNMFGFRNGVGMLNELCYNNDLNIIAVQEHWLGADDLDKFNLVNSDYNFHAISSMCSAASVGILKGRPVLCCLCGYLER